VLHRERHRRRRAEGELRRQQLVEHDAHRVEVAALVHREALELLGRHVGRRADDDAGPGERRHVDAAPARQAEIQQPHGAVLFQHDVAGLDVTVHDAERVRRAQRVDHGRDQRHGVGDRPRAALLDRDLEVAAVDQLGHQEQAAFAEAGIQDPRHRAVLDLAEDLGLAPEAPAAVSRRVVRGLEHLQRAQRAVVPVAHLVHLAHAAAAQEPEHLVTLAEHFAERRALGGQRIGQRGRAEAFGRLQRRRIQRARLAAAAERAWLVLLCVLEAAVVAGPLRVQGGPRES
jgi:hypothetical protein